MSDMALARADTDLRIISVVGAAHFSSHFFQVVLPPLFPLIKVSLGASYTELGLVMTVFFLVSGLSQVLAGFAVDRFGPQRVLPAGMALLAGGMLGIGLAPSFWMFLPLAAIAGAGNCVFHPADYSVLSARVSAPRLARGYAVHTVTGSLGWAVPPLLMVTLADMFGWRSALVMVGAVGLIAAALVALDRRDLELPPVRMARRSGSRMPDLSDLFAAPVVAAFAFFTLISIALGGVQAFMPTMLPKVQGVDLGFASTFTTAYFLSGAIGSFAGGFMADHIKRHELIVGLGLTSAAGFILLIGFVPLASPLLIGSGCMAGFAVGSVLPSRDMLVRAAAPPGATGKIFGFVYSGLDLGSLAVPIVIGPMLDHGFNRAPFGFIALALLCTVGAAASVRFLSKQ